MSALRHLSILFTRHRASEKTSEEGNSAQVNCPSCVVYQKPNTFLLQPLNRGGKKGEAQRCLESHCLNKWCPPTRSLFTSKTETEFFIPQKIAAAIASPLKEPFLRIPKQGRGERSSFTGWSIFYGLPGSTRAWCGWFSTPPVRLVDGVWSSKNVQERAPLLLRSLREPPSVVTVYITS